jgi:hypothetical protein
MCRKSMEYLRNLCTVNFMDALPGASKNPNLSCRAYKTLWRGIWKEMQPATHGNMTAASLVRYWGERGLVRPYR